MRLRYVYLPDYGPLKDVAVVFEQNQHIKNRLGAVNFVVGLNGAGKSSLLRAIYNVFHRLSRDELPDFPVTLAFDSTALTGGTVLFHRPQGPASECFFAITYLYHPDRSASDWQDYIASFPSGEHYIGPTIVQGDRFKGDGNLRNWLPTRVLAYTSGDLAPWQSMAYPSFPADELKDDPEAFDRDRERPHGWKAEHEHYDIRIPTEGDPAYDPPLGGVGENRTVIDERCILLQPEDAKLAAVAVGIWQAALDLESRSQDWQREAFRRDRIKETETKMTVDGARRLLNELDWLWPTHASFHFSSYAQHLRHPDTARCFWLLALADAVVAHPLQEALAIVALGNRPPLRPEDLVGDDDLEESLKLAGEPMRNAKCGAEALRTLFGGEQDPIESLWSIFRTLRDWRAFGLLKDVNLTVKRVRQVPAADGELDDRILSYNSFSDGEQMLLGRMAFLLLLRKQDNSLLLLDEPETHFNDAWKRQIIDMVDNSILKDTSAQVLVSTHTSLALTDVFSCEITRLVKHEGTTRAERVAHPTFGADPGRILLHVFGAPDVIGARAAEFLREKLKQVDWSYDEREKLRALVDEIGSGWPRAKLMELLDELEGTQSEDLPYVAFDS